MQHSRIKSKFVHKWYKVKQPYLTHLEAKHQYVYWIKLDLIASKINLN